MTKPMGSIRVRTVRPRFRVLCGDDIALGPGKVQLLKHIAGTGSIAGAAKRLGMSYMRAWTLIRTMGRCFQEPLVRTSRGGARGGGAELTATGKQALELYRRMQQESLRATRKTWRAIRELLRD